MPTMSTELERLTYQRAYLQAVAIRLHNQYLSDGFDEDPPLDTIWGIIDYHYPEIRVAVKRYQRRHGGYVEWEEVYYEELYDEIVKTCKYLQWETDFQNADPGDVVEDEPPYVMWPTKDYMPSGWDDGICVCDDDREECLKYVHEHDHEDDLEDNNESEATDEDEESDRNSDSDEVEAIVVSRLSTTTPRSEC